MIVRGAGAIGAAAGMQWHRLLLKHLYRLQFFIENAKMK